MGLVVLMSTMDPNSHIKKLLYYNRSGNNVLVLLAITKQHQLTMTTTMPQSQTKLR